MTILERYNYLRDIDPKNIDVFFDLFEEDSKNKSEIIVKFYPFFQYVFQQEGYKRIKRINDIAKRYYNNNPYFEYLYQLLYIQMNYAYSIGDYSRVVACINKFDKEKTPVDFLVGAYCNQLNILTYLKMDEEAYDCIKEVTTAPFFVNSDSYSKGVFYLNAIPLTVKRKEVEETFEYLNLLEKALDVKNFLGDEKYLIIKVIKYYARIFLTKHELIEGNIQELAIEFYNFIMKENLYTQTITFDTNTFITILESILDYCSEKMLYDICIKIISDTHPVNRDLIDFYNFLFKTNNKFYSENEKMKKEHLEFIYKFYNESINNNVQSLKDSLKLQLLEQKYNALESKYNIDILTNCFNRNYLVELESNMINNACVCYLDLDKLKEVNDQYGHTYGDKFLKIFSNTIHESFESVRNQIFRYGGDEFVIVIYNQDKDQVVSCLNKLYEKCTNTSIAEIGIDSISFSCGVSFLKEEMFLKEAIVLADKAMYACKNLKRQQTACKYVIYEE